MAGAQNGRQLRAPNGMPVSGPPDVGRLKGALKGLGRVFGRSAEPEAPAAVPGEERSQVGETVSTGVSEDAVFNRFLQTMVADVNKNVGRDADDQPAIVCAVTNETVRAVIAHRCVVDDSGEVYDFGIGKEREQPLTGEEHDPVYARDMENHRLMLAQSLAPGSRTIQGQMGQTAKDDPLMILAAIFQHRGFWDSYAGTHPDEERPDVQMLRYIGMYARKEGGNDPAKQAQVFSGVLKGLWKNGYMDVNRDGSGRTADAVSYSEEILEAGDQRIHPMVEGFRNLAYSILIRPENEIIERVESDAAGNAHIHIVMENGQIGVINDAFTGLPPNQNIELGVRGYGMDHDQALHEAQNASDEMQLSGLLDSSNVRSREGNPTQRNAEVFEVSERFVGLQHPDSLPTMVDGTEKGQEGVLTSLKERYVERFGEEGKGGGIVHELTATAERQHTTDGVEGKLQSNQTAIGETLSRTTGDNTTNNVTVDSVDLTSRGLSTGVQREIGCVLQTARDHHTAMAADNVGDGREVLQAVDDLQERMYNPLKAVFRRFFPIAMQATPRRNLNEFARATGLSENQLAEVATIFRDRSYDMLEDRSVRVWAGIGRFLSKSLGAWPIDETRVRRHPGFWRFMRVASAISVGATIATAGLAFGGVMSLGWPLILSTPFLAYRFGAARLRTAAEGYQPTSALATTGQTVALAAGTVFAYSMGWLSAGLAVGIVLARPAWRTLEARAPRLTRLGRWVGAGIAGAGAYYLYRMGFVTGTEAVTMGLMLPGYIWARDAVRGITNPANPSYAPLASAVFSAPWARSRGLGIASLVAEVATVSALTTLYLPGGNNWTDMRWAVHDTLGSWEGVQTRREVSWWPPWSILTDSAANARVDIREHEQRLVKQRTFAHTLSVAYGITNPYTKRFAQDHAGAVGLSKSQVTERNYKEVLERLREKRVTEPYERAIALVTRNPVLQDWLQLRKSGMYIESVGQEPKKEPETVVVTTGETKEEAPAQAASGPKPAQMHARLVDDGYELNTRKADAMMAYLLKRVTSRPRGATEAAYLASMLWGGRHNQEQLPISEGKLHMVIAYKGQTPRQREVTSEGGESTLAGFEVLGERITVGLGYRGESAGLRKDMVTLGFFSRTWFADTHMIACRPVMKPECRGVTEQGVVANFGLTDTHSMRDNTDVVSMNRPMFRLLKYVRRGDATWQLKPRGIEVLFRDIRAPLRRLGIEPRRTQVALTEKTIQRKLVEVGERTTIQDVTVETMTSSRRLSPIYHMVMAKLKHDEQERIALSTGRSPEQISVNNGDVVNELRRMLSEGKDLFPAMVEGAALVRIGQDRTRKPAARTLFVDRKADFEQAQRMRLFAKLKLVDPEVRAYLSDSKNADVLAFLHRAFYVESEDRTVGLTTSRSKAELFVLTELKPRLQGKPSYKRTRELRKFMPAHAATDRRKGELVDWALINGYYERVSQDKGSDEGEIKGKKGKIVIPVLKDEKRTERKVRLKIRIMRAEFKSAIGVKDDKGEFQERCNALEQKYGKGAVTTMEGFEKIMGRLGEVDESRVMREYSTWAAGLVRSYLGAKQGIETATTEEDRTSYQAQLKEIKRKLKEHGITIDKDEKSFTINPAKAMTKIKDIYEKRNN